MASPGIWISWVRFNGGAIVEAGPLCHLQIEQMFPKVLLAYGSQKPVGMRVLVQNAAFEPEDGLFECWGPHNPDGILDPVHPWGYVALHALTWEPVTTDRVSGDTRQEDLVPLPAGGVHARVLGAFTGEQYATEVNDAKAAAEEAGTPFLNGWALVTDVASPAELAARDGVPEAPSV